MPAFTVQVQINLSEEGHGVNAADIEGVVLAALWSSRTIRPRLISASVKPIQGRDGEPLVIDPLSGQVPNETRVTINDIVRAVRSGAEDSLRYALEAFYLQCANAQQPKSEDKG